MSSMLSCLRIRNAMNSGGLYVIHVATCVKSTLPSLTLPEHWCDSDYLTKLVAYHVRSLERIVSVHTP